MLILSGKSDISADASSIGPVLIFERLWRESGIQFAIRKLLVKRKFEFDVERAIFLTVLHQLMVSGSDRFCDKWPGNTADVATLLPLVDRLRKRFGIKRICIVADRGLISHENLENLKQRGISYILGVSAHALRKGYRRYLKVEKNSARIDTDKVEAEARFDGKKEALVL